MTAPGRRAVFALAGALGAGLGTFVLGTALTASRGSAEGVGVSRPTTTQELLRPDAFRGIADSAERSRALFAEAGKVLQHPRCVNCHPAGERPLQGMRGEVHVPAVARGPDNFGAPALRCHSCHQAENHEDAGVPGHPKWHLAPLEMAWEGKSLRQICEQVKDRARNGDMTLSELHHHSAHDTLVGWGWRPGSGREPAPGTQAIFGALIGAWIETGAVCPQQ